MSPVEEKNIDLERIKSCIKKVQLDEFASSLEKGFDTIIGEKGARISGGELQRLALARAFYREPDIIILDEPNNVLYSYESDGEFNVNTVYQFVDNMNNFAINRQPIVKQQILNEFNLDNYFEKGLKDQLL